MMHDEREHEKVEGSSLLSASASVNTRTSAISRSSLLPFPRHGPQACFLHDAVNLSKPLLQALLMSVPSSESGVLDLWRLQGPQN
jgi:hypothetical protein